MAAMRWRYRSPKVQLLLVLLLACSIAYYCWEEEKVEDFDLIVRNAESTLKEQLKLDKDSGCVIPELDPFGKDATRFDKVVPKIVCSGQDWVKCYLSKCRVIHEILDTHTYIVCTYRDIIYKNDFSYSYGNPVEVRGSDSYHLVKSDHVKVACSGDRKNRVSFFRPRWSGNAAGFRSGVVRKPSPKGREDTINILIFGFDSTARIGFIRKMPKSYKYLTERLNATVFKSFNIVADGTKGALLPMLTGKNLYELPNTRVKRGNSRTCDEYPLLFYDLRDDGYRTAFFEDRPEIGAFQYWVNGFRHQPTDHYLRAFFQDRSKFGNRYCVGDTPQYKLMMNLTNQFMHLDGKKFIFTFLVDITHEDFNVISTADEDFVNFLQRFEGEGHGKDTLLVVMADHGPRYELVRNTPQGRFEERLPLMALVLPEKLKAQRPGLEQALRENADSLTTPYDIHATLLDAVGLRDRSYGYRVPGADHPRSRSMFEPISRNRSCSEAGIEPHWCACLSWRSIPADDPRYNRAGDALVGFINSLTEPVRIPADDPRFNRAGDALVGFINSLTEPVRSKCAPRTLSNITWVMQQDIHQKTLDFLQIKRRIYQVKITVGPGVGDYEATVTYLIEQDRFQVDIGDISRTNKYGSESECILKTHAYLSPYCFCRDKQVDTT